MPRYVSKPERQAELPPDVAIAEERLREHARRMRQHGLDPYFAQHSPTRRWNVEREEYEDAPPPPPGARVPSFWGDLCLEAESQQRAQHSLESWPPLGDQGDPADPAADADLPEARERLAAVREFARYELDRLAQRDLTSSGFIPAAGAPMFIAEQFATAARGRAALAAALPQQPLSPEGDHIETPRLVTGAAVAVVASENSTVQEADPTSALASSNKALISGQ